MLEVLLRYKADLRHSDPQGNTALIWAAVSNQIAVFDVLLQHGANSKVRNQDGETALDWKQKHQKLQK
ncbi:ankyrin repeat domain-containing protein [Deinococcus roseus]|uniref:Ankyrin repeat domain-containing protein n=1 Tax=Deinococcus roseus TaxID=392414 RepID=A0ABQ2CWE6_9DEIO|nr:ankyrin repeat domain-containing protein [Deinococcus roseus]GGJ27416.1 hypothetical protein GCM10008938_11880 [Deinococcus roseus]